MMENEIHCFNIPTFLSAVTTISLAAGIMLEWALVLYDAESVTSFKVSTGAKIRNHYNQVPHLTPDTHGKATNSQLDTINESQEVSPFPAGDHKAHINRRAQMHSKHKTEKNIKDPQKKYCLGTVSIFFNPPPPLYSRYFKHSCL